MEATLERPAKRQAEKPGIAKARLAYLYGVNGSPPVVTTKELCEIAGVAEKTIWKHTANWKLEAERIAVKDSRASSSLALSDEVLEQGRKDIATMRSQTDLYAAQLDKLKSSTDLLLDFIENFTDEREHALKCFEMFLNGMGSRTSLLANYLKVQAQWSKASGLEAFCDVQVAGAKTVAVARAKMQVEDSDKTEPEGEVMGLGFKRRS